MIGNDHALKIVLFQDRQRPGNAEIAVVEERFLVMRNPTVDIAHVDVSQSTSCAVAIERLINAFALGSRLRHLRERSQAIFELIRRGRIQIKHAIVKARLINQPGSAANRRHGRIVWMQSQTNPGALGIGQNIVQKPLEPPPELFVRKWLDNTWPKLIAISHVPYHSLGNERGWRLAFLADAFGAAARVGSGRAAENTGD
jgi:hypothetical protein